jgi:Domain of unknown function (DUF3883)
MAVLMYVYVANDKNGKKNLARGMETQTWGFRDDQPQYHQEIDFVVFGYRHDSGGPRAKGGLDTWSQGDLNLIVSQMAVPIYKGSAPHWPDEIKQDSVIYPWRFGHVPLGEARVSASPSGPLGPVGTDSMRLSGIAQGRGRVAQSDPGELLAALGLGVSALAPDLSDTVAVPDPLELENVTEDSDPNYPQDAEFRKTVEDHAVALATQHMKSLGWNDIKPLGKPFDLVCQKQGASDEKHVEVKGTTGAGASVEYTTNEVRHFRTCPAGADLIVVHDIVIDTSTIPYSASDGVLVHVVNYRAPKEDLQASRYLGRVPSVSEAAG